MSEKNKADEANVPVKERIQGFSEIEEAIARAINEHGTGADSAPESARAASGSG